MMPTEAWEYYNRKTKEMKSEDFTTRYARTYMFGVADALQAVYGRDDSIREMVNVNFPKN